MYWNCFIYVYILFNNQCFNIYWYIMTNKKSLKKPLQKTPKNFSKFADCVSWVKKSTYLIARWESDKNLINRSTLWTWVVVNNWKMLTCAHVIRWWKWHKDGAPYYFLRHDDLDNCHWLIFTLHEWKNLYIYDKYDLAIIYLEKNFYQEWDKIFKPLNECIKINKDIQPIWSDIGILWYPYCNLTFLNSSLQQPHIWNIILRTDKWVINSRFKTPDWIIHNEFTIQFNPWNSWGPIFSANDWTLLWLVQWYKTIMSNIKPLFIEKQLQDWTKEKVETFNIYSSYYSMWIPVENYLDILKEHNII